jgi:hypothetical protein
MKKKRQDDLACLFFLFARDSEPDYRAYRKLELSPNMNGLPTDQTNGIARLCQDPAFRSY